MSLSHTLPFSRFAQHTQGYLQRRDFNTTMIVVAGLHVAAALAILFWPQNKVQEIPVRSLDITLGASPAQINQLKAASVSAAPAPKVAAPAPSNQEAFAPPAKPAAKPKPPSRQKPAVAAKKETPKRVKISKKAPAKQASIPAPTKVKLPAPPVRRGAPTEQITLAPSAPRQFVRQSSVPSAAAANLSAAEQESIRARYEQKISAWLESNRVSSASAQKLGQHGTTIMRVRLDRSGAVRYFAVERSSGFELLDRAATQMVRRSNPFPAAPGNYPGGNLMEFLIPVRFSMR